DCIGQLLNDTAVYTEDELIYLKNKQYAGLSKWTSDVFGTIKLISNDTIETIFKDYSKWWPYFYKNIGLGFDTFSLPIFLRNDTYCLFYSDHHCGRLCGGGRLTLYKKDHDKWIQFKSYCNWIS